MELLKQKHDFTVDEYISDDPDKIDYPATQAEANERLRKKVKFDLLALKVVDDVDDAEAVRKWTIRYRDRNRQAHQVDTGELLEIYLSSLTKTFDPHSSYLSPKNLEDMLNQQLHLSLEGIGASLRSEDGYAVVTEIVPQMAADRDGRLQPEDKIIGIEKEDGEVIDLVEKKLNDVVRYIRGPRGTKVRLIVQPDGTKEKRVYEITREKIELKEQHAKSKIIESKATDGKDLKIGVINLPAFYGDTVAILRGDRDAVSATGDCRQDLERIQGQGRRRGRLRSPRQRRRPARRSQDPLRALHRHRPGRPGQGSLRRQASRRRRRRDRLGRPARRLDRQVQRQCVGDLRGRDPGLRPRPDHRRHQHVRQRNRPADRHDQRPRPAPQPSECPANRGALKLTIQQFYRANGESTQINGVPPHIHIPSMNDQRDFGEGKMDNAFKFDKVGGLPHDNYNRVPADLVALLNERSADRRKADPKFQKLDEQIKKYIERKARHSISLNEAKFRAEYVPEDPEEKAAEEKAKKERKKKKFNEREVWASDFYNDEVIHIVTDYLSLGSKVLAAAPERAKIAGQ